MNEFINIISRTHNRPEHFKKMVESVKNQTYEYINHIVICDNHSSVVYVREYGIEPYYINPQTIVETEYIPQGRRRLKHNLYFNQIDSELIDGYIIYVDDDDHLSSNTIIEEIMNESEKDTMLYFKVKIGNRYVPSVERTFPVLNDFSGSGFLYHTDYWGNDLWAGYSAGDFHCGMLLNAVIPKKKWINKTVVIAPSANFGKEIE